MENSKVNKLNSEEKVSTPNVLNSNPLGARLAHSDMALTNYTQEIKRPKYDSDIADVIEIVRVLNNMAPISMPVYNFNIDEINGERYYRPDGTLLLVREYDNEIVRDYYATDKKTDTEYSVSRVLEHDKISGRLKAKIEPTNRQGSSLKINITIFDLKVNNKYTLFQLSEDGTVNSITEFTGQGKSFQTLFRNPTTHKPVRYLEGKESMEIGFEMVDCIFTSEGQIARIKRFTSKKEVVIDYTQDKKKISVKTKE